MKIIILYSKFSVTVKQLSMDIFLRLTRLIIGNIQTGNMRGVLTLSADKTAVNMLICMACCLDDFA